MSAALVHQNAKRAERTSGKSVFTIRKISDSLPEFMHVDQVNGSNGFVLLKEYEIDKSFMNGTRSCTIKITRPSKDMIEAQRYTGILKDFATALRSVYPTGESETDIHVQSLNRQRSNNENMLGYYFRMRALAQNGTISEAAAVLYITCGLNDARRAGMFGGGAGCLVFLLCCSDH